MKLSTYTNKSAINNSQLTNYMNLCLGISYSCYLQWASDCIITDSPSSSLISIKSQFKSCQEWVASKLWGFPPLIFDTVLNHTCPEFPSRKVHLVRHTGIRTGALHIPITREKLSLPAYTYACSLSFALSPEGECTCLANLHLTPVKVCILSPQLLLLLQDQEFLQQLHSSVQFAWCPISVRTCTAPKNKPCHGNAWYVNHVSWLMIPARRQPALYCNFSVKSFLGNSGITHRRRCVATSVSMGMDRSHHLGVVVIWRTESHKSYGRTVGWWRCHGQGSATYVNGS